MNDPIARKEASLASLHREAVRHASYMAGLAAGSQAYADALATSIVLTDAVMREHRALLEERPRAAA